MLDSVVVEVVTGLALLFFLVASMAAAINEVLSRWADARAKTLWRTLEGLLASAPKASDSAGSPAVIEGESMKVGSDIGALTALSFGLAQNDSRPDGHNGPDPLEDLLSTPSIRSLDPVREYGKPTKVERIPGRIFAFALLELAKIGGSDDADSIERKLRQVASDYPNSPVGTFLETIAGTVGNDIDRYLNLTSSWFDQQMTRLTEIYRKNARWVLFIIGCVAALTFNIDALEVGHALRDDSNLRAGVLLIADDVAKDGVLANCTIADAEITDQELACAREQLRGLNALKVPVLGEWNEETWRSSWSQRAIAHLAGLLLTAGAVSLGAPFWYDVLRWLTGRGRPNFGS